MNVTTAKESDMQSAGLWIGGGGGEGAGASFDFNIEGRRIDANGAPMPGMMVGGFMG